MIGDAASGSGTQTAATKRFFAGTHRTRLPAETLGRLRPLLPTLGITRVANITGLDRIGIPVAMVCRPDARSVAVFQGKGVTLHAAKVSGIMEALEVWHAERIDKALKLASAEEMHSGHRIVDLTELPRLSAKPIDRRAPLLWIEAADLQGSGRLWVPFELVGMNYTMPPPTGSGVFQASSNGLASGNHWLEAVCHGLCEVIERDARTLWHLSRPELQNARMLDLDSVTDAPCSELIERIESAELDLRAWDVTSDIGIATFVCQLLDPREAEADAEVGSGCHPARHIALLRALTEAAQARATYIAGARDDFLGFHYGGKARTERRQAMLRRSIPPARLRRYEDVPDYQAGTVDEDVHWILVRLRATGIAQALAVDLTREAIAIPVVRIIVPGLEGPVAYDDFDHAPGARAQRAQRMS
jgi:YcaO-like protein with predicted kinase domain